jgi:hypothetical protein
VLLLVILWAGLLLWGRGSSSGGGVMPQDTQTATVPSSPVVVAPA